MSTGIDADRSQGGHVEHPAHLSLPPWMKEGRGILSSPLNEGDAVFEREKRVLARHYLDEGMSKSEVVRRVGIGRRTWYNWIADGLLEGRLGDQNMELSKAIHPTAHPTASRAADAERARKGGES